MDPFARAAEILAADPRVGAVYAFGSAAHDEARPTSDLDIAISVEEPLSLAEELRLRARLVEALGRDDIDLVILENAAPLMRHEVIAARRRVFARDPERADDLETAWQREYLDTQYLRDVQQRIQREMANRRH